MKKVKVTSKDETVHEFNIIQINSVERDDLLEEYFDMNKFMNSGNEGSNMMEMIKPGAKILKFTREVLEKGIDGLDCTKLLGNEKDKLFQEYMEYIMGFDTKN